ncbi:MAG: preprotein translocase subunit SecG [Kiloniellales bacterium]
MSNILLIIHLLIALALIGIVLLQRSEGGGLGIGGGGGGGGGGMAGFMTGRGTANLLTRVTAVLAALFMISSMGLTIFFNQEVGGTGSLTDGLQQEFQRGLTLPESGGGESGGSAADGLSLPSTGGSDNSAPQVE